MQTFDVAIIGSGIGGSSLATILARLGFSVVVFDATSHPRFAIGESMILETSELMRALAELYDVPEIAYFSSENFADFAGSTHGVKRHFGFLHHSANQAHDPARTLQAVIPRQPHGHELHLYRQDSDYFLMTAAVRYGATVLQNTPIAAVDFSDQSATVTTKSGDSYSAAYVVDAAGFGSVLSRQFELRRHDLLTHSRGLFTHMVGVDLPVSDGERRDAYGLPFPMNEGTLHHVFDGGWLWVIPFNNHKNASNPLVSVGLMLDPRQYPLDNQIAAETEFRNFIAQYPSIDAQFKNARAVRHWTRSPRIQYRAERIVGDRWALLGHAAGFIDPLYSKGLYVTFAAVSTLVHLLLKARVSGDYSAAAFAPLESLTQRFIATNDRLVANSYRAFSHPLLWQHYAALWLLGAYTEYVRLNAIRAMHHDDHDAYYRALHQLYLAGGGFDEFRPIADRIDQIIECVDVNDEAAVQRAAAEIRAAFATIDWMPEPFTALLDGKTYLPRKKLRLGLLRKEEGFLGRGAYRRHFFGDHTTAEMVEVFMREKLRYLPLVLRRRYR